MIDLNQLAVFVQVVQAGSFAQAARRLSMPPTTLSRQVAQLEDALQARLLQRSTRKLSLTDAGRRLFDDSVAQVDALRDAADQLLGARQTPQGSIRVAASASFFDFFEMAWIAEFLQTYPLVRVEFVLSDGMADFVAQGIDVAFRGSSDLPDSSLVARKLATGALILAASPAYLAERGRPSRLEELAEHDCITAGGATHWRLSGPEGPVSLAVSGRFSANTGQAQKKAAVQGLGICLLPSNAVQSSLQSGELVEVLPGVASVVGNLYVVYPSRRHVPSAVTAFVEMATQRGLGLGVNRLGGER
jgi:DNA-binding transcriptional LysR family regulator